MVEGAALTVLSGVIGGFITAFIFWIGKFIKDTRIARRYPLSGTYVASFDDNIDTGTTAETVIVLKQRGRRVWGFDKASDGREWKIDDQIIGKGHFCGIYSAVPLLTWVLGHSICGPVTMK